ncbi:MAG: prefoldin subunit beta [Candidatus Odinarchaeia archaeon]
MNADGISPQLQQELLKREQLKQQYEIVVAQRAQLEIQLKETEYALQEIEKLDEKTPLYKSVGTLLIKGDREQIKKELEDAKETLELRVKTLQNQEEQLRKQVQELSVKLQSKLKEQGLI